MYWRSRTSCSTCDPCCMYICPFITSFYFSLKKKSLSIVSINGTSKQEQDSMPHSHYTDHADISMQYSPQVLQHWLVKLVMSQQNPTKIVKKYRVWLVWTPKLSMKAVNVKWTIKISVFSIFYFSVTEVDPEWWKVKEEYLQELDIKGQWWWI